MSKKPESLSTTLTIAIIGAGNVLSAHVRGLGGVGQAEVRIGGIYDLDQAKAQVAATRFDIPKVYPDLNAVLADETVDIVAVITPPGSHKDLAVQALRAGKHVLSEKPMAESVAECREMLAVAQENSRRLFVVQNRIYTDAMQKAREMISRGDIGAVRLVKTAGIEGAGLLERMPSIRTDALGVINTAGIHQTYVIPWLIGQTITGVKATLGRDIDSEISAPDGTAVIALDYNGGAKHAMLCTFESGDRLTEHYLEIVGTAGRLRSRREGTHDNRQEVLDYLPRGQTDWQSVELTDPSVIGHEFEQMWRGVLQAIRTGGEPELSAETAARSVYIVHKIYEDAARPATVIEAGPVYGSDQLQGIPSQRPRDLAPHVLQLSPSEIRTLA